MTLQASSVATADRDASSWEEPKRRVPVHRTLVERLRWRAATQPDQLAVADLNGLRTLGDRATFHQLDTRARALAARLQDLGVQGEQVMLVMGNTLDYIVAFFACSYAGAVAVNLPPPSRPKHLARLGHVAEDCGARLLLTGGVGAEALVEQLRSDPRLAALEILRVDHIPPSLAERYRDRTPAPEEICHLQYTSGSTGTPKGVAVSHGNLMVNSQHMQGQFGFTPADRALSWLPLYHDMGLILGVLQPLFVGFPVLLTDPLSFVKRPDLWLRAISEHRITFTGGPNFTYDLCVDAVDLDALSGVDLSCWKVALNGAEPIRASTLDRFNETFTPLGWRPETMSPAYGLAEFTLEVSTAPRGTLPVIRTVDAEALNRGRVEPFKGEGRGRRLVSSGRRSAGARIAIVDLESGERAAPGRTGEIWLGGPSVAQGYFRRAAETLASFGGRIPGEDLNWFRTGDLGFMEGQEVFVTGRLKDVIIAFGANHYPQDLEETAEGADPALRPHFVAVFAEERGEREALIVVAEVQRDAVEGLDVDRVARRIALAIARDHEIQVDEVALAHHGQVPKTTSGKIQRSACRASLRSGSLALHGVWSKHS